LKTKGRIVIWVVAVQEEEKNGDRRSGEIAGQKGSMGVEEDETCF
jgi:hypothetical protein